MTRQLTVTLETVTPLFLAGADPRGTPELRPPAFRGAMRYWWRALAGGVIGDWHEVQKKEGEIWGNTDSGSPVIVRLQQPDNLQIKAFQSYSPSGLNRNESSGHDYLLWSMKGLGGEPDRAYIVPNQAFNLELKLRPGSKNTSDTLWEAAVALWIMVQLGGLGSRSRRTGGGLRFSSSSIANSSRPLPDFGTSISTPEELATYLEQGLSLLRTEFSKIYSPTTRSSRDFDVLHPDLCKIWVVVGDSSWTSWLQAIEGIGATMRDFRNRKSPDYQNIRQWMKDGNPPDSVERAIFGLPLPFHYSSEPKVSGVVQGTGDYGRRASPLHLHVSRLANNSYVGVLTLFMSDFLPRSGRLRNTNRQARDTTQSPSDFSLIEDFINTSFLHRWEVQL